MNTLRVRDIVIGLIHANKKKTHGNILTGTKYEGWSLVLLGDHQHVAILSLPTKEEQRIYNRIILRARHQ